MARTYYSSCRPSARLTVATMLGGLLALGVAATPCFSQEAADTRPRSLALSCLPPGAKGIFVVHPAAILRKPGMARYAQLVNQLLPLGCRQLGLKSAPRLKVEEVEEVVGTLAFRYREDVPEKQRGSMMAGITMIRTVKDCSWKSELQALGLELEEVPNCNGKIYQLSAGQAKALARLLGQPAAPIYLAMPDRRTLIHCQEEPATLLNRINKERHDCDWAGDWKHVEQCLAACAFTTSEVRSYPKCEELGGIDSAPFWRDVRHWTMGIDHTDRWRFQALAACPTEKAARGVKAALASLLSQLTLSIKELESPLSPPARVNQHFGQAMIRHARAEQRGTCVRLHTEAEDDFAKVIEAVAALCGEQ